MADDYSDDTTAVSTSTKTPQEGSEADSESSSEAVPPAGIGPLLEKSPEKAVKIMNEFWDDSEPLMGEFNARWKANDKRREGVIGVHVVKPDPDRNEWKVWAPPGAARVPPTFNKPARLCRRLVANMFVDEPLPEVTPGGASDTDKSDAAEYATRILQDVCTGKFFNVAEMSEEAVDLACTFDSAFVRVFVDPRGNGSRPRTIMASKAAMSVKDALYENGDGVTPQPSPYVTRYVKDDETLTDDPRLAELEWLPGLRYELLTGVNLRPIPATATKIEDCQGVVIRTPAKLGDLKKQYPDALGELTPEELWELVGQRPSKSDSILNPADRQVPRKKGDDEPPPDDTTIVITMVYMAEGGSYPAGAYAVAAGVKHLLHRQKWEIEVNEVPETLPIPIAHFKGWSEGKKTFYGYHLMHFLGPGQEVRAAALGGAIEHLDRFNRRKTFYSPQSLFQPKANPAALGLMVPIQPGTKPEVEAFPEYPSVGMEIFNLSTVELDDDSGLLPISQGQTDPSVQSGLHAQKIIEQVNIGLGTIKRSTNKGVERLWSISAVMIRGYYTTPQQIRYRGDDQAYKEKDFTGVDLADAKDVRILKGSFTMLAPSAKLAVAEYMRKLNLIDDNQLRMMAAGNIGGLMGLQDDPALLRIRRQISAWENGPPKPEHPSEALPDEYAGETAIEEPENAPPEAMPDPAVVGAIPPAPGTPMAVPDPMLLAAQAIFKSLVNDEEPAIAQIRFRELSRSMCSTKYEGKPEPWKAAFDAEYQRMRKAAGVGTAAEAAANQQAAQQAEQQKEAATIQAKNTADQQLAQLKSQEAIQLQNLKDQAAFALEKLRLEHESVMKNAELEAQGDGSAEAEAKLEATRLELAAEAEAKRLELAQQYEIAQKELEQAGQIEREKIALQAETDLAKTKIQAQSQQQSSESRKRINIERGKDDKITGAEIVPEGPGADTAQEA